MFLMWGYDGEDIADVEATIDHVKECRPDIFFTTVSYPIKGTPYFDKVAARLVSIKPWSSSTDREVQIRGRHSRRFYQYADELLRVEMSAQPDEGGDLAARNGLRAELRGSGSLMASSPMAAFDRMAPRYDDLWTNTDVGRLQREAVWRHIDPLFRAGSTHYRSRMRNW